MADLDYEAFEKQVEEIKEENEKLLATFENWLAEKGLSEKTINKHLNNVDFFLNFYLVYYDPPTEAKDGWNSIGSFLGDFFIRKAMWSSPAQVRSGATSLKKFYACMLEEYDILDESEYKELTEEIKDELPEWMETSRRYDDESYSYEEVWGWG